MRDPHHLYKSHEDLRTCHSDSLFATSQKGQCWWNRRFDQMKRWENFEIKLFQPLDPGWFFFFFNVEDGKLTVSTKEVRTYCNTLAWHYKGREDISETPFITWQPLLKLTPSNHHHQDWNRGITKDGKDLQDHQVQPLTKHHLVN